MGDRGGGGLPISSGEGSSPCRAAAVRCRRGGASGGWGPSSAPPPASPSPPHRDRRWWWDRGGRICPGVAPTIPSFPTSAGGRLVAARGGERGAEADAVADGRTLPRSHLLTVNARQKEASAPAPSLPFHGRRVL
jgi:hypothetical protein